MTEYLCPKCKKKNMSRNGINKSTGKQNYVCRTRSEDVRTVCYSTVDPTAPYRSQNKTNKKAPNPPRKAFKKKIDVRQTLVFTAAQNATPVHEGFFDTLTKAFCPDQKAELCIIPLRYKNPTSMFSDRAKDDEVWFVPSKYLYEQRKKLNQSLTVVGDVKIQPTAVDPLTGMEGLTHGESGIFGHTKLRMKCVATPQNKHPKVMTTTGACTVPNYTDSKAGKKGDFHHVLGAVVVQIESATKFHIHHVNARKRDGAFIFKNKAYYPSGAVENAPPAKALIFGDAHYRFADPKVVEATFGPGGLVDTLDPEVLVWHDLLDCYFGNPHHKDNPFIKKAKHKAGFHLARPEVQETVDWLCGLGAGRKNVIVASNHDDMFARWVIREDWKELDPENMEFYLETALIMARTAEMSEIGAEYVDPFAYWVERMVDPIYDVTPLKRNQPFSVGGIVLDNHGDKGPNGARGTIKNLSQIGAKIISGHGHTPAIQDGHYRTGTMTRLTAEYVTGPNNWLNTHASIDAFDKRHLHTCVDGKFYI